MFDSHSLFRRFSSCQPALAVMAMCLAVTGCSGLGYSGNEGLWDNAASDFSREIPPPEQHITPFASTNKGQQIESHFTDEARRESLSFDTAPRTTGRWSGGRGNLD